MNNIDLIYSHDHLMYKNIKDFSYDSDTDMVWFTDGQGNKHEARKIGWHRWESK